jgi:Holliday junction resolvasome RuvABC ATP-dependent DNA helicase subunit
MIESTTSEAPITPVPDAEDAVLEVALRPSDLSQYVGQESIKRALGITMTAAKKRGEQLEGNGCSY